MRGHVRIFSQTEIDTIRVRWHARVRYDIIAAEIGCGYSTLQRQIERMGLQGKSGESARTMRRNRQRLSAEAASDLKFKKAMLFALALEKEKAVIGVVKDRRAFSVNTMRPEPSGSGCGSPALACVTF